MSNLLIGLIIVVIILFFYQNNSRFSEKIEKFTNSATAFLLEGMIIGDETSGKINSEYVTQEIGIENIPTIEENLSFFLI